MNSNTQRALGAGHRPTTVCERQANVVVPVTSVMLEKLLTRAIMDT